MGIHTSLLKLCGSDEDAITSVQDGGSLLAPADVLMVVLNTCSLELGGSYLCMTRGVAGPPWGRPAVVCRRPGLPGQRGGTAGPAPDAGSGTACRRPQPPPRPPSTLALLPPAGTHTLTVVFSIFTEEM